MAYETSQLTMTDAQHAAAYPDSQATVDTMLDNVRTQFEALSAFAASKLQYNQRRNAAGTIVSSTVRLPGATQDSEDNLYNGGATADGEFYDHAAGYKTAKDNVTDLTADPEVQVTTRAQH